MCPPQLSTATSILLASGAFLVAILNFTIKPNPHVTGHQAPSTLMGIGFFILGIVIIFPVIKNKFKK
jgi:hypothetical protein